MSDQSKSTLEPDDLPESPVFRETFLTHLEAEEAALLRRLGRVLRDRILEGEPHDTGESVNVQELRAAALDLVSLVGYLRECAAAREHSTLDPREHQLCGRAEAWAVELSATAADMLNRVGTVPAGESGGRS